MLLRFLHQRGLKARRQLQRHKRNVFKFKKLKKNKKYYVKARAVKVVGKTKYYGEWSKVKKIRIKK